MSTLDVHGVLDPVHSHFSEKNPRFNPADTDGGFTESAGKKFNDSGLLISHP
ncbi:hypothetical protein [Burkholderia pyrrocinia]|uniref:hypothetical protein n=1 Tax=Burkholderia pyrrocinia TaxID=60550 RepID=UPI001374B280|nr:hypothetical protein [Burkholderia pyrrocinia]